MFVEPVYSSPELARIRAWRACICDARKYIALAREIGAFVQPDQVFNYTGGTGSVRGTVEKSLLSAAVISAGQLVKKGRESENVANNHSDNLVRLRDHLFQESDKRNNWAAGKSKAIFKEQVETIRDSLIAHYDGSAGDYVETVDETDGSLTTTWAPPNPYLSAESFADLEQALCQMEITLRAIFFRQIRAEASSGSAH